MQRYKVVHNTYYNFSDSVQLERHTLRLRPREGHELRIESSTLQITPPATLLWHRDVEGNSVAIASFESPASQLAVKSEILLQQFNEEPLNFLVSDYALNYPFTYLADDSILLSPYMELPEHKTKKYLTEWLSDLWHEAERIQTYTLLLRLCTHIYQTMSYQKREEHGVQTSCQTLSSYTGCCRDFALLFIEAVRCLGFAARFVSGYLYTQPSAVDFGATHAWAEVYLPGAGWKGFDPTIGAIAGADHITVAVARLPESVTPISGSFIGVPGASLDVGVWVTKHP